MNVFATPSGGSRGGGRPNGTAPQEPGGAPRDRVAVRGARGTQAVRDGRTARPRRAGVRRG